MVHRDLKPANILLSAVGQAASLSAAGGQAGSLSYVPKITDFGLARQLDSDSGETQAGQVMGTPSYMAPEQASGRCRRGRAGRGRVCAWARSFTHCLTGRPPFQGKTVVETLDQVRTQEPVPPSRWQPRVPLDLDTICLKCLRKEPEKRYASAAELADELVRVSAGQANPGPAGGCLERSVKWVKRNPLVAGAAAVVALVLVAGAVIELLRVYGGRRGEGRPDAEKNGGYRSEGGTQGGARSEGSREGRDRGESAGPAAVDPGRVAALRKQAGPGPERLCGQGKHALALQYLDECQWDARLGASPSSDVFHQQANLPGADRTVSAVWRGAPTANASSPQAWDMTAKVWTPRRARKSSPSRGTQAAVRSVAWSPDGKYVSLREART